MKLLMLIATAGVLFLYTNCDGYNRQDPKPLPFQLGNPLDINNFKEPPPPLICGRSGWDFMLRNYIKQNCSACHYAGGFASPPFAADNLDTAYNAAKTIAKDRWQATVTDNRFCVPNCNLSRTGQMYEGLMEWVDNKYGCP